MKELPDHYAALGIRPTADQEVIAAAFRALVKKYHPDTAKADGEAAAERFRAVTAAHDVLGHPERRREYDDQRKARGLDRDDGAETEVPALAGDAAWRPSGSRTQALPGRRGHYSTRPAETVLRAERAEEAEPEESGGLFRFAVMAVLCCFIAAGGLLLLWPSVSGSFGSGQPETQALQPPPQPASQPQNVTETAKTDPADGGDSLEAAIPQGAAIETPPAAQPKPVQPKPAVQKPKPQPEVLEEEAASLYALTMREEANGLTTTLADGTLTFNSRKACEDFAQQARDRRLDASIMQTGEQPQISWECRGR